MPWTTDEKVEWLLRLPWAIQVVREEDGGYFARVENLPSAVADGATSADLDASFWASLRETVRAYLEAGDPIPLPGDVTPPWERETTAAQPRGRAKMLIRGRVRDIRTPHSGGLATA